MRGKVLLAALGGAVIAAVASAADVWVVHGHAFSRKSETLDVRWEAWAVLHNETDTAATVRLVGGSDGAFTGPVEVTIPARQSIATTGRGLSGTPAGMLWVTHLDVPAGIDVEGRLELWNEERGPVGRPPALAPYAKLTMPVFRRLVSAGEEHVHRGTDLGGQRSRLNLTVYNAGAATATARVTQHAPLCAANLAEETFLVGANQIVQVPLKTPDPPACDVGWVRTVRVVLDQPGFSFISVLSAEGPPDAAAAVTAN